jgi:hypothetical protein
MFTATWPSLKSSPMMHEIRVQLKGKSQPGQPTMSRKESNRTWREDILGIRSEEQKKADKAKKQKANKRFKQQDSEEA